MINNQVFKRLAFWLCPFAGAMATSTFLIIRSGEFDAAAFAVWFSRDALSGYFIALPLLFLARVAGVRSILAFMLVAAAAALPMAYVLAHPLTYAWTPTEEDFVRSPYLLMPTIYASMSSITGLIFGFALSRAKSQKG
jgi:hypothetical protein